MVPVPISEWTQGVVRILWLFGVFWFAAYVISWRGTAGLVARLFVERSRRWNDRLVAALKPEIAVGSSRGWSLDGEFAGLPLRIRETDAPFMKRMLEASIACVQPSALTIQRVAWADESEPALRTTPGFAQSVRVSGRAAEAIALLSPAMRREVGCLLDVRGKLHRGSVVLRLQVQHGPSNAAKRM